VHDDQLGPSSKIELKAIKDIKILWEDNSKVSIFSALAIIHPTWIIDVNVIKKQITSLNLLI
jgi:hypothetical protein